MMKNGGLLDAHCGGLAFAWHVGSQSLLTFDIPLGSWNKTRTQRRNRFIVLFDAEELKRKFVCLHLSVTSKSESVW